jgi:hypothetical protein
MSPAEGGLSSSSITVEQSYDQHVTYLCGHNDIMQVIDIVKYEMTLSETQGVKTTI